MTSETRTTRTDEQRTDELRAKDEHTDLRDVEPLRPIDDPEPTGEPAQEVDRVGLTAAATMSSTPAVGVTAEVDKKSTDEGDGLEDLRR